MKIEIDWQPKKEESPAFYGVRLYPETNEEMANLERFIAVGLKPYDILGITTGNSINYLIEFGYNNEKKK